MCSLREIYISKEKKYGIKLLIDKINNYYWIIIIDMIKKKIDEGCSLIMNLIFKRSEQVFEK